MESITKVAMTSTQAVMEQEMHTKLLHLVLRMVDSKIKVRAAIKLTNGLDNQID